MKQTAFIFGRTPALSLLELQSFYPKADLLIPGVAQVTKAVDAQVDMGLLGGTVKIIEVIDEIDAINADALVSLLTTDSKSTKVTFGISGYGGFIPPLNFAAEVKKKLVSRGLTARYVETKKDTALSSVVVSKQQIIEIVIIKKGTNYFIGITRAVQDFEDWNTRDFGRPAADPKAGMLPPKVARMIVNVALSKNVPGHTPMVLDPFCGVGTIIAEALLRGANTVGSDISEVAVRHAKKNMEWLRSKYPYIKPQYANIFVSDATHISDKIAPESIDVIITEPFLGETIDAHNQERLSPERTKNILRGLEKLYIGALREWIHILVPGGKIIMAMPSYMTDRGPMRVKKVVDRCEILGYTLLTGPIEYSRPQAVVRREFYIFQKN